MFPLIAVVGAILRSPSMTSGAPMSPAWIMWSVPARCFIASGRRRPCVSEIIPIRIIAFARGAGCADHHSALGSSSLALSGMPELPRHDPNNPRSWNARPVSQQRETFRKVPDRRAGQYYITRFPVDWNLALAHIVTSHDPTNPTFRGQLATAARGQMPLVRLDSEGLSIDCEAVGAE